VTDTETVQTIDAGKKPDGGPADTGSMNDAG
jgi:hypothetical protein